MRLMLTILASRILAGGVKNKIKGWRPPQPYVLFDQPMTNAQRRSQIGLTLCSTIALTRQTTSHDTNKKVKKAYQGEDLSDKRISRSKTMSKRLCYGWMSFQPRPLSTLHFLTGPVQTWRFFMATAHGYPTIRLAHGPAEVAHLPVSYHQKKSSW